MRRLVAAVGVFVVVAVGAYFLAVSYLTGLARREIDRAIGHAASVADISYDSVRVRLVPWVVQVRGVTVAPVFSPEMRLDIDEIAIHSIDREGWPPQYARIKVTGIRQKVSQIPGEELREVLRALAYEEEDIQGRFEIDYRYDPREHELEVRRLSYGVERAGRIALGLKLGNLELGDLRLDSVEKMLLFIPGLLARLERVLVYGAQLGYEDDSLIARGLMARAENVGQDVEAVASEVADGLAGEVPGDTSLAGQARAAIRSFLRAPGQLTIVVAPAKPVPVGRIRRAMAAELIPLLGVSIRSEPGKTLQEQIALLEKAREEQWPGVTAEDERREGPARLARQNDKWSPLDAEHYKTTETILAREEACAGADECKRDGLWFHRVTLSERQELRAYIVRMEGGCGSGGCNEALVLYAGGKLQVLAEVFGGIAIHESEVNGLREISLRAKRYRREGGPTVTEKRFVWNGSRYVAKR